MSEENFKVFIIDDDPSVRRSLSLLLRSAGYLIESYGSAEELLDLEDYTSEGCIILDIFMEGRSGLELQDEINQKFEYLPIIYISGRGDIPMSVRALKKGAINFLQKPVDEQVLLKSVAEALEQSCIMFQANRENIRVKSLVNCLTPRESQIFKLIITGMLNKQIAAELNIAEHTVKLHRGKITEKLGVKSVAELVKLAQRINL